MGLRNMESMHVKKETNFNGSPKPNVGFVKLELKEASTKPEGLPTAPRSSISFSERIAGKKIFGENEIGKPVSGTASRQNLEDIRMESRTETEELCVSSGVDGQSTDVLSEMSNPVSKRRVSSGAEIMSRFAPRPYRPASVDSSKVMRNRSQSLEVHCSGYTPGLLPEIKICSSDSPSAGRRQNSFSSSFDTTAAKHKTTASELSNTKPYYNNMNYATFDCRSTTTTAASQSKDAAASAMTSSAAPASNSSSLPHRISQAVPFSGVAKDSKFTQSPGMFGRASATLPNASGTSPIGTAKTTTVHLSHVSSPTESMVHSESKKSKESQVLVKSSVPESKIVTSPTSKQTTSSSGAGVKHRAVIKSCPESLLYSSSVSLPPSRRDQKLFSDKDLTLSGTTPVLCKMSSDVDCEINGTTSDSDATRAPYRSSAATVSGALVSSTARVSNALVSSTATVSNALVSSTATVSNALVSSTLNSDALVFKPPVHNALISSSKTKESITSEIFSPSFVVLKKPKETGIKLKVSSSHVGESCTEVKSVPSVIPSHTADSVNASEVITQLSLDSPVSPVDSIITNDSSPALLSSDAVRDVRIPKDHKLSAKIDTSCNSVSSALSVLLKGQSGSGNLVPASPKCSYRYGMRGAIFSNYQNKLGSSASSQYNKNMDELYGNFYKNLKDCHSKDTNSLLSAKKSEQIQTSPVKEIEYQPERSHESNLDKQENLTSPDAQYTNNKSSLNLYLSTSQHPSRCNISQPATGPRSCDDSIQEKVKSPVRASRFRSILPEDNSEQLRANGMQLDRTETSPSPVSPYSPQQDSEMYFIDEPLDSLCDADRILGVLAETQCPKRNKVKRHVSFDPVSLLLNAALEGELDLVKVTIPKVGDTTVSNDFGVTALHNAVCNGHYEVCRFLIECGYKVNATDADGWTPLHCAASHNNVDLVKLLVQNGACLFAATFSDHKIPIQKCTRQIPGFDECYRYLCEQGHMIGVANGGAVYAANDYTASTADELSFHEADQLTVLRRGEAAEVVWWLAKQANQKGGKQGYVPRDYLAFHPLRPKKQGTE